MAEEDRVCWGIHGGREGTANALFLERSCVALGWSRLGDLTKLKADRETFKTKIAESYPERKAGAIPVDAGLLYRFVYEVKEGNIVVYPSKVDKLIHLGRIEGPYRYDSAQRQEFPHTRPVKWVRTVPRTQVSQGALYEVGSAISFFLIKNYADEFLNLLEGQLIQEPAIDEETVGAIAQEIEQNTRDFVLKRLFQDLKGHPLAFLVADLLREMGYRTRVSPQGSDRGIDIVAHRDELGFEPPIIKVQVKSGGSAVGNPEVAALYGNVGQLEYGLFVSLGGYTNQAKSFALGKANLRLIDGEALADLVLEHYEQLDSRYKGLIPLKRVYVPEPLQET